MPHHHIWKVGPYLVSFQHVETQTTNGSHFISVIDVSDMSDTLADMPFSHEK